MAIAAAVGGFLTSAGGVALATSVGGALLSSRSAGRAAGAQVTASERAIAEQRRASEQARGDLSPFRLAGEGILNQLGEFVSQGPETDFERTQGFEDIQQSVAARGKLVSGETLGALTEFNVGVNQRFRSQRFNELLQLANLGQVSAAGSANIGIRTGENVSNLLVGIGDARAAGIVGQSSAIGTGINELGSFLGTLKGKG